jgi:hypothetical protein
VSVNVRENKRGHHEWTIQRETKGDINNGQSREKLATLGTQGTGRRQTKQKQNGTKHHEASFLPSASSWAHPWFFWWGLCCPTFYFPMLCGVLFRFVFVLFVFVLCLVFPVLPMSLDYPFLIAPFGFL